MKDGRNRKKRGLGDIYGKFLQLHLHYICIRRKPHGLIARAWGKSLPGPAHGLEPTAQQLRPLVSSLKLRHLQKSKQSPFAKAVQEVTPNGLVDWMVQAGREHDMHVTKNLTTKDTTRWKFGQDDEGRLSLCSCRLRTERNGDQKA